MASIMLSTSQIASLTPVCMLWGTQLQQGILVRRVHARSLFSLLVGELLP